MTRTLIKNCLVVPMDREPGAGELFFAGDIAIEGDRIVAVGPPGCAGDWTAESVLDCRGKMAAIPGLINAHTHAAMTLFRGYADDLPLMEWLQQRIWPLEARLSPDDIYWGTQLALLEMLRSGITAFADMYFAVDRVAEAVLASGMRACLARGLIGIQDNAAVALQESRDFVRQWHGAGDGKLTCMLGPHAPYTCPPDFLEQVISAATGLQVGLHIHLAETAGEVDEMRRLYGQLPIELMQRVGLFTRPVLAAHCVHLSLGEIELLAAGGAVVAHNPESNLKLASGIAPVPQLLAAGVPVALGTDGASSNNNLELWGEMRAAALIHKGVSGDPTVTSAYRCLAMATSSGAQAIRQDKEIGKLSPGYQADVVLIDLDQPHFYPHHDLIAHLVYSAQPSDVHTVIIKGRIVLQARQFLTLDAERVYAEVNQRAARIIGTPLRW